MEQANPDITVKVQLNRDDVGEMNAIYLKARKKRNKKTQLFFFIDGDYDHYLIYHYIGF